MKNMLLKRMLDNFLKKSWNPLIFRIIATFGFLFFLLILYFSSLKIIFNFDSNFVMLVLWVLWWPFLYITLFFLGRAWCGFVCPISLANEIGNTIGNFDAISSENKFSDTFKIKDFEVFGNVNHSKFSIKKTKKDYLAKFIWLPFVLFFIIVLWEQISGLFSSPSITLYFLISFFVSAFFIGIIIPRWGFCKYFCPIGTLLGVFSRLSIIGVRIDKEKCEKCETKECLKGWKAEPCPMFNYVPNLNSNKDCLICTNCIKNCPHDSAKLQFVRAGEEINKKINFNIYESFFIVSLLGFTVLLTSRGTNLLRIFDYQGIFVRIIDFILAIGVFFLLYFILNFIFSKSSKTNFKENLITGGYILLPLTFSLMFFLITFGFITPLTNIDESYVAISKYIVLGIGVFWSSKLAWNFYNKNSVFYIIFIVLIALLWSLILIPGPLNVFNDNYKVYEAKHNEVVQMRAFSMGFEPKIIKINSGGYFDINITNSDIIHTFDIDELGIHVNLNGGETKQIRVNALNPGVYEYYCNIPGHREAGMKGTLIIE